MKQNYVIANRHNDLPTPSKRSLSNPVTANAHQEAQSSQPRLSNNLMEQLRKDVFNELKLYLCLELHCLR